MPLNILSSTLFPLRSSSSSQSTLPGHTTVIFRIIYYLLFQIFAYSSIITTAEDEKPSFVDTFTERILHPGNSLSISCSATGNPLPQITWTLDEVPFPSSHRIRYGDFVSSDRRVVSFVNISAILPEDGGLYRCTARNVLASVSHQGHIRIYGSPSVKPMGNITALDGDTLSLYCPVNGYPIKRIWWEKDGKLLPQHDQQQVFPNGSLLVTKINRKMDTGHYSCFAQGEYETVAKSSTYIRIIVGPRIDPFTFLKDLEEGMRSVAVCAVSSGDPPIRITWLKDGHHLNADALDASIEMLNSFSSTISFHSLTTKHTGNYTCLATNAAASDNHTAELIIKVAPYWIKEPSDQEILTDQRLSLDCQAGGFPEPQIRWKRLQDSQYFTTGLNATYNRGSSAFSKSQVNNHNTNGRDSLEEFKTIISNPHMHILENGSLQINQVTEFDKGQYMCQASNGINPGLSKVIHLRVNRPPKFEDKYSSHVLPKGNLLRLYCNSSGDEPLVYHWKKDKVILEMFPDTQLRYKMRTDQRKSMLEIESVAQSDSGLFTCTASNSYGEDEKTFRVVVQEEPEAPFDLRTPDISSTSALIAWGQGFTGNSPITDYLIQFRKTQDLSSDSWHEIQIPVSIETSARYQLEKLTPSTSYDVRVASKNLLGQSKFSEILKLITLDEPPNFPPTGLSGKATGSTSIKISWLEPSTPPQIKGYKILYRRHNSSSSFTVKDMEILSEIRAPSSSASGASALIPPTPTQSSSFGKTSAHIEYQITSLKKQTKYEIKVQAYNSAGNGPLTKPLILETFPFDPPKGIHLSIIRTTTHTIEIEWSIPTEEVVSGFIVYYKEEGGDWSQQEIISGKLYTLSDLKCGTKYQIYMAGFNDAGVGHPSDTVLTRTDGSAPIAPDKSAFLTPNSTFVLLNLQSWLANGCPIRSFDVQYRLQGDKEFVVLSSNIPSDSRTLVISDLSPGRWYNLFVRAVNDAGRTDAEYIFSTLLINGATISPLFILRGTTETGDKSFLLQIPFLSKILTEQMVYLLPFICLLIVISFGSVLIFCYAPKSQINAPTNSMEIYQRTPRKDSIRRKRESEYKIGQLSTPVKDKIATLKGDGDGIQLSSGQCREDRGHQTTEEQIYDPPEQLYYPSPYAFSHISEYSLDSNVDCDENYKLESMRKTSSFLYHNYDTPVFVERTKSFSE